VADVLRLLAERHPALAPLLPHLRVAVDQEFSDAQAEVRPGAELALIPPVAGGSGLFAVVDRPLRLEEVVEAVSGEAMAGSSPSPARCATRRGAGAW
jgi:molybdopterin synthase catalytic subunit